MSNRTIYIILFSLLGVAYIGGLFLHIMEIDAAQYAAMSMEMLKTHHFLKLYDGGGAYLDKPPLLMWLSSLSFYLFGISDFTYRLPSFLATILAVYSTYRLAKQWYGNTIAIWSALILASCQAFFLFNNDVKTDNLLTSMVIFSIWQLSAYIRNKKVIDLLAGFVGVAMAMLAKGPIGLIVPATAIGCHLLLHRDLKGIFDWKWLLAIPIILIILSPMLYGLYEQWGARGIIFFFWTQSFGRITGQSDWNNHADALFFVHTYAWAFLPWTICGLLGLFYGIKELITSRFRLNENQEGMTIAGFILMFAALSLSHYKLPHYIFVLFPLAAIFTARWIYETAENMPITFKWLGRIQTVIYLLLGLAIILLLWFVFSPLMVWVFVICLFGSLVAASISLRGINAFRKVILPGVIIMFAVNFGLNYGIYPRLLKFQPSNEVGMYVSNNQEFKTPFIPPNKFYTLNSSGSHSLNFYARRDVRPIYSNNLRDILMKRDIWLYLDENDYPELSKFKRFDGDKDQMYYRFSVQNMSIEFLNPETRLKTVHNTFLVHLDRIKDSSATSNK